MSNYFIQKDKTLARKAEGGGFLQGNQAHVVKITQAYYSVNDKGTQSLNLSLVNADGDKGDIRLHFANDGGELPDYNKIMAILELTNVEGISQNTGTYEAYDFDQGDEWLSKGLLPLNCWANLLGWYCLITLPKPKRRG